MGPESRTAACMAQAYCSKSGCVAVSPLKDGSDMRMRGPRHCHAGGTPGTPSVQTSLRRGMRRRRHSQTPLEDITVQRKKSLLDMEGL
jgi:hypothetical protein